MAKKIKIPFAGANCRICGQPILGRKYEAVKQKRGLTLYYHPMCIEEERTKR